MYDFLSDAAGKAMLSGIYDNQAKHALVKVGQSAVTSELAVASIRPWWKQLGAMIWVCLLRFATRLPELPSGIRLSLVCLVRLAATGPVSRCEL